MDYIIGIGSEDSDYGAINFENSKLSLDTVFKALKVNKFEEVEFNQGFSAWIEYEAEFIDKDLIFHIKNDWMDYDSLKDTEYFVVSDDS